MTLEEWKQLQIKEKKRKPQFNTRKPGEGQDTSQWKKTYLLENKKNQDEQVVAEEDGEYEEVEVVSLDSFTCDAASLKPTSSDCPCTDGF